MRSNKLDAELAGSGIFDLVISGSTSSNNLNTNTAIMAEFVLPITAFSGLLIMAAVVGTIVYFATYLHNPYLDKRSTKNSSQEGELY
jgi:hypothetical protein